MEVSAGNSNRLGAIVVRKRDLSHVSLNAGVPILKVVTRPSSMLLALE